ncbi:MAG: UvrB/UvrC motif-containing protein [Candidatus Omnitrophica bacterium]|nr:UvrB/UvrC motif-containing protein [Candidatus Omnitrophota bacterium]MDD5771032.1 UvrB/UvrC motif-containing protein [Candidatus Omnitrophota bacterium]
MLCDICKKNQATVHLTEIIDDQMTELHLCEECARHKSAAMEQQFGLSDLLAGMADFGKPEQEEENSAAKCPNCNLTYADFKKIGRLGCGDCYNAFRKYLAPLLKRIHGSSQHVGKSPLAKGKDSVKSNRKGTELVNLKAEMQRAIQKENFEEAARLRDQIRAIESKKDKG